MGPGRPSFPIREKSRTVFPGWEIVLGKDARFETSFPCEAFFGLGGRVILPEANSQTGRAISYTSGAI
jgi:hypothetical protein